MFSEENGKQLHLRNENFKRLWKQELTEIEEETGGRGIKFGQGVQLT